MFLFSVHAAVLFSACLATDSIITLQNTRKDKKPDFILINRNPSISINDKPKIIMNEPKFEKRAIGGINWNENYKLLNVYRRRLEKTTIKNHQRNFDNFAMYRKHNAPFSNNTVNIIEPRKHKIDGRRHYRRILKDIIDSLSRDRETNALSNKTDNSTEETKNSNRVLVSSKENASMEPLIVTVFTGVSSNNPDVGLNIESLSDKTSLVSKPEPEKYEILLVKNDEPGYNKSLLETNNEPNNFTHVDSELKSVSSQLPMKDLPKYALFVKYDSLNSSNKMEPTNENIAITTEPQIYEPYPFTYEPVKNRHQFQTETVSHFKPTTVSELYLNDFQNYSPVISYFYLPPIVSSVAISAHQTPHRIMSKETKPYSNNKPAPKSNTDPPRVKNYETATYYHNKPEINSNPEPKISNYNSVIFEPRLLSNFEPDNLQPANFDAPSKYDPVNYVPYEPRNYEPQNYETSQFSNNEPQTYERLPSKQLVYNYSHQSHLDNQRNEGLVEILDVVYDDDDHDAQIIDAMNKQTLVMEKLANVIHNENRRKMKLSRGEKHFNELLEEIEEWNNKSSTTPKQKQSQNATKVTPSIISVVDETEIRKALKQNPLVKRVLKMAARKRKEYFDAVKNHYNITT